MERRDVSISRSRSHLIELKFDHLMGKDELFQTKTIKPIVKFQRQLILDIFKNYVRKHKNSFCELQPEAKLLYIENAIQKDLKFRNILKGVVIGQFTLTEYAVYIENSSALNKRIMLLIKGELQENLLLLEENLVFLSEKII